MSFIGIERRQWKKSIILFICHALQINANKRFGQELPRLAEKKTSVRVQHDNETSDTVCACGNGNGNDNNRHPKIALIHPIEKET